MGFKTAAGGALEMPSADSLKRARHIFEEETEFTIQSTYGYSFVSQCIVDSYDR